MQRVFCPNYVPIYLYGRKSLAKIVELIPLKSRLNEAELGIELETDSETGDACQDVDCTSKNMKNGKEN